MSVDQFAAAVHFGTRLAGNESTKKAPRVTLRSREMRCVPSLLCSQISYSIMSQPVIDRPHPRSYAQRTLHVLKAWIKQPSQVATICPSSPHLTRAIAERSCIGEADRVIELGPGAGGTTLALLEQMKPTAQLLAIEKTRELAAALNLIDDERLIHHCGDAADLISIVQRNRFGLADVVVSGIPFSTLPSRTANKIVSAIDEALQPGGTFMAYQLHDDVCRYAEQRFGSPSIASVPINLPPLKVYSWTKPFPNSDHDPAGC